MKKLYLLLIGLIISLSSSKAQQVIYVNQNAPAGGNGTSWATALDSLHEALVLAQSGDEIWVAKGTYTPYLDAQYQVPADPREATFALKKDVSLYGSFTGNETSPSQRNWSLDSTILSGDIGLPKDSDNVYNVLSAIDLDSTIIEVDGLYLTGTFSAFVGPNPVYSACGFLVENSDSILLENCTVYDNYTIYGTGLSLTNSIIGIQNSSFKNNYAQQDGGAIHVDPDSKLYCSEVLWSGNGCAYFGGAIENISGTVDIRNSVFHNNYASLGGAMYNSSGIVRMSHVTEVASVAGGSFNGPNQGFRFIHPGERKIFNSVITGRVGTSVNNTASVEFRNCLLTGSRTANNTWRSAWGTDKGGNIDAKPLFVDSLNENFNLAKCSPGIDAGNNNFIPMDTWDADGDGDTLEVLPYDYAGNTRIINSTVDMGAYEAPLYNNTGHDTVQFCVGTSVFYKGYYIDEAGVDTLIFQAAAGCDSTVYLQANQLDVDTSITVSADGAILTATASGTSFLWFDCNTGAVIFADTLPVFTPDTNGLYKVVIVDKNGCQDTSSCISVSTIGLENQFSIPSVSVYPNPVKKELWIKTSIPEKATEVQVYSTDGRQLLSRSYSSGNDLRLELGFLKKGIYILHIRQDQALKVVLITKA
ncbi:MAG: T9SS type A sorting domain-containing protein [Owenweeksia sp.]